MRSISRNELEPIDRRTFLLAAAAGLMWPPLSAAQSAVTRPVVSEEACPLDSFAPEAADGHRGLAVMRKPPGPGPFPAVIWFHGGITTVPVQRLEEMVRDLATLPRLLAAGYLVVAPTYRSRDVDLQSPATVADALAVVDYVRRLDVVDGRSVIVAGCSGGGDLALETAARTEVCAVVAEEPASVLMTGVFNNGTPKKGERYTPEDSFFMLENGRRYYRASMRPAFMAKLKKIHAPILIVQGDEDRAEAPINRFNADVLIPELRAAGKDFQVSVYPKQAHCFCSASGAPRPNGAAAPASWPSAALKASQDIQAFLRRHVRTRPNPIAANLITQEVVRQGPIA